MKEKIMMWFAWHLPKGIVYWCAQRVLANATQGEWSHQEVPALLAMDALRRWPYSR